MSGLDDWLASALDTSSTSGNSLFSTQDTSTNGLSSGGSSWDKFRTSSANDAIYGTGSNKNLNSALSLLSLGAGLLGNSAPTTNGAQSSSNMMAMLGKMPGLLASNGGNLDYLTNMFSTSGSGSGGYGLGGSSGGGLA